MKFTTLSLVATLAVSSAYAGGDIIPVAAPVAAPVESMTTVGGKLTAYYITNDNSTAYDMFSYDGSQLGLTATLDVSHKFTENIVANFSALGYANTNSNDGVYDYLYFQNYFESNQNGAIFNIANITATYADTTFVLGRQFLDTPMVGGMDWLLSQGSFEAYTAVNTSFENVTLVGGYIREYRPINAGDDWLNLTDINDGNNWMLGAAYDDKTLSGSLWYYNIDAGATLTGDKYTQVYLDGGYSFGASKLEAQYANTAYDILDDSNAYGVKLSGDVSSFSLMAAYAYIDGEVVGYIERDSLYTSSWNTIGASKGNTFKVEAGSEFAGISATASYAYYEYEQNIPEDEGHEADLILGYNITDEIDFNVVYSNTDYGIGDATNALEVYVNYKF